MKRSRIPIIDGDVFFTNSEKDARAFIRRHGGDDSQATDCLGCCVCVDDKGMEWRVLAAYDGRLSTVVHEAVHMAWILEDRYGLEFSHSERHEMEACLVSTLFNTFRRLFPEAKK